MQYWILSVKDSKWSYEKERRYIVFDYDDMSYVNLDVGDDIFVKLDTTLFGYPDFIMGDDRIKEKVAANIIKNPFNPLKKDYKICDKCLGKNFANYANEEYCLYCNNPLK